MSLVKYAHDHRIATDYHINETPVLEQDEHFKHLSENQTYFPRVPFRKVHPKGWSHEVSAITNSPTGSSTRNEQYQKPTCDSPFMPTFDSRHPGPGFIARGSCLLYD
jgi:hypothetical protein